MVKSNTPVTTQGRQHQDQDRSQQRPGRPQPAAIAQIGQKGSQSGRTQRGGEGEGTQGSRGGRSGQGPYTSMEGTSETAILRTCMDSISETFNYCLEQGDRHVDAKHLRCMMDCWDVLQVTSTFIARDSEYADRFKEICADAVKACEESCEEFEGDERMTACGDSCREAYAYLTGSPGEGSGNPNPNRGGGEEE